MNTNHINLIQEALKPYGASISNGDIFNNTGERIAFVEERGGRLDFSNADLVEPNKASVTEFIDWFMNWYNK